MEDGVVVLLGLHAASRAGQVERVRLLVEQERCDVNEVDFFNSTPLYYAVYGGHEEVARLLLSNGALCEASTFVGERCFYGALNESMRKMLKARSADIFSARERHPFAKAVGGMARDWRFCDAEFLLGDEARFAAPRFSLGARSPFLAEKFAAGKKEIRWRSAGKDPRTAHAVLEYLATGRFALEKQKLGRALTLAKNLKLSERFLSELASRDEEAQEANFVVVFEDDVSDLRLSFAALAETVARPFNNKEAFASCVCDVKVIARGSVEFRAPCAILRHHSKVLDASLGNDQYKETRERRVDLDDVEPDVVGCILRWLVQGSCALELSTSPARLAAEVLATAHRLMLPVELLNAAAGALADKLDHHLAGTPEEAALDALGYAQLAPDSSRLHEVIRRHFATNLERLVENPEFHAAVRESAFSILDRQDTDSVPIIDELRTTIKTLFNPFDDPSPESSADARNEEAKLKLLDDLLANLGIQG